MRLFLKFFISCTETVFWAKMQVTNSRAAAWVTHGTQLLCFRKLLNILTLLLIKRPADYILLGFASFKPLASVFVYVFYTTNKAHDQVFNMP